MGQIQQSRGCNQNRDIMIELLREIEKEGGTDKLFGFLQAHYPHMLVGEDAPPPRVKMVDDPIFPYFNPALLTYPRRRIIEGENLKQRVQEFLLDKGTCDYAIVGDRAYVEYLDRKDAAIIDKIPLRNWLIAQWRSRQSTSS